MSKHATMASTANMRTKAKPAAAKARFSTTTKWIAGAGVLVLALGGAIIAAMPEPGATKLATSESRAAASPTSAGTLSALTSKFSFGTVSMAAGKVTHRYWVRNMGSEPLLIRKLYTSCMCTTATLIKGGKKSDAFGMPGHGPIPTINTEMNPGDDAVVEVVFDPAAHGPAGIGPIERVVTIENSAGRPLELAFNATVTP